MMATVIESKEKQIDIDTISEYEREEEIVKPQTKSYAKDIFDSASEVISVAKAIKSAVRSNQSAGMADISIGNCIESVKNLEPDVLETLWPGVHHDFSHSVSLKRAPSYYLTLGFAGGAVIALIIVWSYTTLSSFFSNFGKMGNNVSQSKLANPTVAAEANSGTGVRVPAVPIYTVQDGDTLAAIALRNYKHVSPRLLDEICKANNMTDANVLSTGHKLTLPEYHY